MRQNRVRKTEIISGRRQWQRKREGDRERGRRRERENERGGWVKRYLKS